MTEARSRIVITVATVAIAVFAWLAWYESRNHNREQLALTKKQSEAAFTAIQQERIQFSQERKRWDAAERATRKIRDEEREEREQSALKEQAPYLVILQCCNPREVSLELFRDQNGLSTNRRLVKLVHESSPDPDARPTKGFVALVKNVGGGPALETRVNWKIKVAQRIDGTMFPLEELNRDTVDRTYLWPKVIHIGNEAAIRTIPGLVSADADLQLDFMQGQIELICKDTAGRDYSFLQQFELRPYYDPLWAGFVPAEESWKDTPLLSFHFNDLSGHHVSNPLNKPVLKEHSVAKPLIP